MTSLLGSVLRVAVVATLASAENDVTSMPLRGAPDPPDMPALECAIHQLAFEFGTSLVATAPQALHDALNLGNCSSHLGAAALAHNVRRLTLRRHAHARTEQQPSGSTHAGAGTQPASTFVVALSGSDTAAGTQASPFATLHHAASAAAAAVKPALVLVRGGKYYLSKTLALTEKHSGVAWRSYNGEQVTISGGLQVRQPAWKPYKGGIIMAPVNVSTLLSQSEHAFWAAKRQRGGSGSRSRRAGGDMPLAHAHVPLFPPAPAGWQLFPGHCLSETTCTQTDCSCADRAHIVGWEACPQGSHDDCYSIAAAACTAIKTVCTGFAILNTSATFSSVQFNDPGNFKYELYTGLRNDSAVPNPQWTAYAMRCLGTPTSPCHPQPPHPPGPPPTPSQ